MPGCGELVTDLRAQDPVAVFAPGAELGFEPLGGGLVIHTPNGLLSSTLVSKVGLGWV